MTQIGHMRHTVLCTVLERGIVCLVHVPSPVMWARASQSSIQVQG
jgi:hypothetical protein